MDDIKIIQAEPNHLTKLLSIAKETFINTYAHLNDPDNFNDYLKSAFTLQQWKKEIENPYSYFFLLLKSKQIPGYIKLNYRDAQTEKGYADSCEIERIYVRDSFKGFGFGKALIEQAIRHATLQDAKYIWLGVWEQNRSAISFYKSMGFVEFDTHIFQIGNDPQQDILMKRPLAT